MAQKTSKKKYGITVDEEKDIFLSFMNKKVRNVKKKLEQIDELEKKDKDSLKPEQLEKIKSRAEALETIKSNDAIKDLYYQALKAAQDEGRPLPQQGETQPQKQEEDKTEKAPEPKVEEPRQVAQPEDNSRIIRETLSKVLNLVHFAQLFRDQRSRQALESRREQFGVESLPDFESFHEFFVKVFTFSESDRFGKVGDKINGSLAELESYINAVDQPALRNKSYRHLQQVVEAVTGTTSFRGLAAEVEVPKARTVAEPSAIGSELKKTHEHQEAPVQRSPEKERGHTETAVRTAERTAEKAAPVQQEETRQDWGNVEDDEEEQEEVREEQEEEAKFEAEGGRTVEEEKPVKKNVDDDGFTTVTRSYPKKEETGYKGSGTRGQRGGYKGGYRGGKREEGQEGGYRPRPRRDDQQQEGGEGQQREGGQQRGEYRGRGGRGGYRGEGRGGYRGEGRGNRGGYRGGNRREGENQGERQTGAQEVRTGQEQA